MNNNEQKNIFASINDDQAEEMMDLFAEELPEQNDLAVVASTFSSLTSISSATCPSTFGTLTTASSLG